MSVRKSSHGTIFLIVSSGSPRALIASSLRSTSKKPVCPMTRSLHPPMTAHGHRVRFVATWREEFFEVPICLRASYRSRPSPELDDVGAISLRAEDRNPVLAGSRYQPFLFESSSAFRLTAARAGFFVLSQSGERAAG